MTITIDLTEEQLQRLEELAKSLSVNPRELAQAAVSSLLARPAEDFERAASYVLEKNKEFYDRLGNGHNS